MQYSLNDEQLRRLAAMVKRLEHQPIGKGGQPNLRPEGIPNNDTVRITSTTQSNGRYPGKLVRVDCSTNPPTYTDVLDVWVNDANAIGLATGKYYSGRRCNLAGSPSEQVYLVTAAPAVSSSDPIFGASGTNHAPGDVPDPGPTAGSRKLLCENVTFIDLGGAAFSISQSVLADVSITCNNDGTITITKTSKTLTLTFNSQGVCTACSFA